jgi:hypothetical protein
MQYTVFAAHTPSGGCDECPPAAAAAAAALRWTKEGLVCTQCGCVKRGTSRPLSRVFSASSAGIAAAMPVLHNGGVGPGRRFAVPSVRARGGGGRCGRGDRLRQQCTALNRASTSSFSRALGFRRAEKAAGAFRSALAEVAHGAREHTPRLLDGCRGLFARAQGSPRLPKLVTHEDYAAFAAAAIVHVSHAIPRGYSPFPLRLMRDVLAHRCDMRKAAARLNDMAKAVAAIEPARRKSGPQAVHRWSRWITELPLDRAAGPPKEPSLEFGFRRDAGTRLLVALERAATAARVGETADNALCAALLWIAVALLRGEPALHPDAVARVCGADKRVRATRRLLTNASFVAAAEAHCVPPSMLARWHALRVQFCAPPAAAAAAAAAAAPRR